MHSGLAVTEDRAETTSFDLFEELGKRDAQGSCQPKQVLEGRIPARGFDSPQVRSVHRGQLGQTLLRVAALAAQLSDARRQELHCFLFGCQTSSVFCCRLLVYRILVTIDMQDRYAGDVGDFGKFGLLRHLCGVTAQDGQPNLRPGIIWYRGAR